MIDLQLFRELYDMTSKSRTQQIPTVFVTRYSYPDLRETHKLNTSHPLLVIVSSRLNYAWHGRSNCRRQPTNSPRAVTALMQGRQGIYESSLESLASPSAEITMNEDRERGRTSKEMPRLVINKEMKEHRPGEERYRNLFYE